MGQGRGGGCETEDSESEGGQESAGKECVTEQMEQEHPDLLC